MLFVLTFWVLLLRDITNKNKIYVIANIAKNRKGHVSM